MLCTIVPCIKFFNLVEFYEQIYFNYDDSKQISLLFIDITMYTLTVV